jgi:hypothetical protein
MSMLFLGLALLTAPGASALTMGQFSEICEAVPTPCTEHPLLRAYVGGALDLLATLDEETAYLDKIYCAAPGELFDVTTIIRFMERYRDAYAERNAMQLLVRYVEEQGGCKPGT